MIDPLLGFLSYFATALGQLVVFVAVYVRITPYREFRLIREGNLAASLALLGAISGFALPVASAIAHSVNLMDMALWAGLAMAVQLLVYLLIDRLMGEVPRGIANGTVAHGAFLGGLSLTVGLINAACITY